MKSHVKFHKTSEMNFVVWYAPFGPKQTHDDIFQNEATE